MFGGRREVGQALFSYVCSNCDHVYYTQHKPVTLNVVCCGQIIVLYVLYTHLYTQLPVGRYTAESVGQSSLLSSKVQRIGDRYILHL